MFDFMFSIEDEMSGTLAEMVEKANDLSAPQEEAGYILQKSIKDNFIAGGRPDPWVPRKKDVEWPLLIKTGALMDSIEAEVTSPTEIDVFSDSEYAAAQDMGTEILPARPFMIIQEEDADKIEEIFSRHFGF
jgi:phage gpG-like protein